MPGALHAWRPPPHAPSQATSGPPLVLARPRQTSSPASNAARCPCCPLLPRAPRRPSLSSRAASCAPGRRGGGTRSPGPNFPDTHHHSPDAPAPVGASLPRSLALLGLALSAPFLPLPPVWPPPAYPAELSPAPPPVSPLEELRPHGDPSPNPASASLAFLFGEGTRPTPSGRSLPAKYVSSVSAVISRLRESLAAGEGDRGSQFRAKAEAAKDAIRGYLQQWRGKGVAQDVDSALEAALRELSQFYSKSGPTAILPQDTKQAVLDALERAEAFL